MLNKKHGLALRGAFWCTNIEHLINQRLKTSYLGANKIFLVNGFIVRWEMKFGLK